MAAAERLAEDWLRAEREGRRIAVSGRWGTAEGFVASPSRPSGGWLGGARRAADAECTVLVAPQWPGIEDARACAEVDRALCAALLRAGHAVAHVRSFMPAAGCDALGYSEAVSDVLGAACGGTRPALAGTWLAGTACAAASTNHDGLAFLCLVSAPSAEVLTRRTPENEDDPSWVDSPSLRLADGLAALSPLEALPAAHVESWRASLEAASRPCQAVELAFVDAFMRPVDGAGRPDEDDGGGRALLASMVESWSRGALSRGAQARRAR
jgi:hypothetical protein